MTTERERIARDYARSLDCALLWLAHRQAGMPSPAAVPDAHAEALRALIEGMAAELARRRHDRKPRRRVRWGSRTFEIGTSSFERIVLRDVATGAIVRSAPGAWR